MSGDLPKIEWTITVHPAYEDENAPDLSPVYVSVTDLIPADLRARIEADARLEAMAAWIVQRSAVDAARQSRLIARLRCVGGASPVCRACGESDPALLSIDHIMPRSRGGSNSISNKQILCRECNGKKGALTMTEWAGATS